MPVYTVIIQVILSIVKDKQGTYNGNRIQLPAQVILFSRTLPNEMSLELN